MTIKNTIIIYTHTHTRRTPAISIVSGEGFILAFGRGFTIRYKYKTEKYYNTIYYYSVHADTVNNADQNN